MCSGVNVSSSVGGNFQILSLRRVAVVGLRMKAIKFLAAIEWFRSAGKVGMLQSERSEASF